MSLTPTPKRTEVRRKAEEAADAQRMAYSHGYCEEAAHAQRMACSHGYCEEAADAHAELRAKEETIVAQARQEAQDAGLALESSQRQVPAVTSIRTSTTRLI